jgi:hypothetical protein
MRQIFLMTILLVLLLCLSAQKAQACSNDTYRIGASGGLPDCRAYEQVSPMEKDGTNAFASVFPLPVEVTAINGYAEGSSVAYQTLGAFAGPLSHLIGNAYLATRTAGGWQTSSLTPPTPGPIPTSAGAAFRGYDFSPDLSRAVIGVPWQALVPGTPALLENLFLRGSDGSYSLLTTAPPKVPVPENCVLCYAERDISAFAGASSDYAHVIFEASESLTPSAPGGGVESLYESYEALPGQPREVRLVGILPDGKIPAEDFISSFVAFDSMPGAGIEDNGINHYSGGSERDYSSDIQHAISADGSHVIFSATADGGVPDSAQGGLAELYDRVGGSKTIEISAPAKGATPTNSAAEPARFWAASADGSLVFFTSSAELTTQSNTGSGNASQDLYRYAVNTGVLTDLTVDSNPVDASSGAGVQGVVGASEDGSFVYFVATGQLTGGAVDGQPNLYVSDEGGPPRFITTLNGEDSDDWTSIPAESNAYITPDGRHLAFMSIDRLTGYDNEDQNSGQPDNEVYEYSAVDGSLVCASCEPSGIRPVGNAFTGAGVGGNRLGTAFYQPRVLSDNGTRLFFSSPEHSLVSGVGAGHMKVFEYEQDGSGSCAQAGGCVYPISSSASSANDVFLDASPRGSDVFFATYDQLVSGDSDNLMDIYDARVGGGFPPAPSAPVSCAVGACQGPPAAPPVFGAPSSTTFSGVGNLTSTTSKPAATRGKKTAAQIKAEKLARALKTCKSKSNARRKSCEAQALKRYGSKSKTKANRASRRVR